MLSVGVRNSCVINRDVMRIANSDRSCSERDATTLILKILDRPTPLGLTRKLTNVDCGLMGLLNIVVGKIVQMRGLESSAVRAYRMFSLVDRVTRV